jgi:Domain of unknown function (DUF4157)
MPTKTTLAGRVEQAKKPSRPSPEPTPKTQNASPGMPLFMRRRREDAHLPHEREADQVAEQAAEEEIPGATGAHQSVDGQSMPPAVRTDFEERFGQDLSDVRIHAGPDAAQEAHAQDARAFTADRDIVFNQGEYAPQSREGRKLLAHELTHVVQQDRGVASGTQRKKLEDAPAAQRKALSLPSTSITISDDKLKEYFEKLKNGNWGAYKEAPKGVTVTMEGIDAGFLTPMTSIAMHMRDDMSYSSPVTGETKQIFGSGITVSVYLPLAKHGMADGVYRFAWTGSDTKGVIYIESAAGMPKEQNTLTDATGSITIGKLKFEYKGSWAADRLTALKKALALIPEAALGIVDGLKFEIQNGSGPDGEDGHYDEDKHTIVIFTSAFKSDDAKRMGESTWAVFAIAHEIGHAIDRAPLSKAWADYQTSGSEKKLKAAVSPSGAKWEKDGAGTWQIAERITKVDEEFRKAASKDGVAPTTTKITDASGAKQTISQLKGGVSEYGAKDWTELYAESFALYTTDPMTLKLIRPNIHAYFAGKFPRTKP